MLIFLTILLSIVYSSQNQPTQKVENYQNFFISKLFKWLVEIQSQQQEKTYNSKKKSCISLQNTLELYPFIKENMDTFRFANLIQAGGCRHIVQPVRFYIIDNIIYKFGSLSNHQRTKQFEKQIKSLGEVIPLPNLYMVFHIEDELIKSSIPYHLHNICNNLPLILFNKNCFVQFQNTKILLPDPYILFYKWNNQTQQVKEKSKTIKWQDKISKMYFRGSPTSPTSTPQYHLNSINQKTPQAELYRVFQRGGFVLLSYQHPELIDAKFNSNKIPVFFQILKRVEGQESILTQTVNFTQSINFKYLLSADGFGAAWRRVPLILFSNSLLFKVESQKIQFFYDKMIPGVHYIQINNDLTNLFTKMNQMNKNPQKAKKIVQNANQIAEKYLTIESIKNFAREVLVNYSKIQKFSLSSSEKLKLKQGKDINLILSQRHSTLMSVYQYFVIIQAIIFTILVQKENIKRRREQPYSNISMRTGVQHQIKSVVQMRHVNQKNSDL